jgi:hypothetical protein
MEYGSELLKYVHSFIGTLRQESTFYVEPLVNKGFLFFEL